MSTTLPKLMPESSSSWVTRSRRDSCRGAAVAYLIADKNVEILPDRTLMGHSSYPIVLAKGSQV